MTDRFSPGRLGDWVVFCDICGQKCYASEASKLEKETGRGGLIVCKNDADRIDHGLVPYYTPPERNVPWTRINHTNTDNAALVYDLEAATVEQISSYQLLLLSQGSNDVIALSQDEDVVLIARDDI